MVHTVGQYPSFVLSSASLSCQSPHTEAGQASLSSGTLACASKSARFCPKKGCWVTIREDRCDLVLLCHFYPGVNPFSLRTASLANKSHLMSSKIFFRRAISFCVFLRASLKTFSRSLNSLVLINQ